MSKRVFFVVMTFCLGAIAWAAAEQRVDKVGSAFPMWFDRGIYVGPASANPTANTVNKVMAIRTFDCQNIDIPAAAASVQANVTCTYTGTGGPVVGDVIVGIGPQQDDAAFDDCVLSGFVESANVFKIQSTCDTTGGDPAATNDYFITFIKRQ